MPPVSLDRCLFTIDLTQNKTILEKLDTRPAFTKIADTALAIFREIGAMLENLFKRFFHSYSYHVLDKQITWKKESEGLCVLVHGLFSHPSSWNYQLGEFKNKRQDNIDLFVPYVPKGGDCALQESAAPILEHVRDYALKNPGKPICILGHSNAGRIAVWLEEQMRREAPSTPVKVSVIAGIPFGTDLSLWKALRIDKWLLSKEWTGEADSSSQTAKELLARVRKPLEAGVGQRSYEFYATTSDFIVPNIACSLPFLGKEEEHHLIHGEGHFSVIKKVAATEVDSCVNWIKKINSK